ncbi:MAG: hypothetical protein GY757_23610 [bacterium]|nr:hypothetical protein [bacterium]
MLSLIEKKARLSRDKAAQLALKIKPADRMTFYLSGRPMKDGSLFYADNFIMLPVWIQVLLHDCKSEKAVKLINKLAKKQEGRGGQ